MSTILLLIITLGFIFLILLQVKNRRILKLLGKVPAPPGYPIVGHIFDFVNPTKILDQFLRHVENCGGVFRISSFWVHTLVVTDHRLVEEVLSTTKILSKAREYEHFENWLGTGLLTSQPDKWKKTRKIITPTFHFQILEQFLDVFDSCSNILVEKLRQEIGKSRLDVHNYVTLCALDVICESAMGTKVNAQVNAESPYVSSVKEMGRIIRERLFSPIKMIPLFYYLSSDYRKEKAVLKILHDYTSSVIRRRRAEINDRKDEHFIKSKRLAFLDLLLQSTLDDRPMTDYEIRQEVDTFMFEGHDTTALAISAALFSLSCNHGVQNRAVKELDKIFGHDTKKSATYEDLQNMKYLEMVIKETLRLYPSVPIFARKVEEDTQFANGIVTKDVSISIFAWGLHRNPEIYPNPEVFDPERFTLENQNMRSPFSYIPFSAGPRNCIGQRFAMLEMKSTISKVLRHFEIWPVEKFKPIIVPDVILKSLNGMEVCLKERK